MGLAAAVLAIQIGAIGWWLAHPAWPTRYVVLAGIGEIAIGLLLFWFAPVLHGRFAPPGIQLMPHWALWGLTGPTITGIGMIAAAIIGRVPGIPRAK
jgi:hypothetical protein